MDHSTQYPVPDYPDRDEEIAVSVAKSTATRDEIAHTAGGLARDVVAFVDAYRASIASGAVDDTTRDSRKAWGGWRNISSAPRVAGRAAVRALHERDAADARNARERARERHVQLFATLSRAAAEQLVDAWHVIDAEFITADAGDVPAEVPRWMAMLVGLSGDAEVAAIDAFDDPDRPLVAVTERDVWIVRHDEGGDELALYRRSHEMDL